MGGKSASFTIELLSVKEDSKVFVCFFVVGFVFPKGSRVKICSACTGVRMCGSARLQDTVSQSGVWELNWTGLESAVP